MDIYIKNDAALGGASLCESCTFGFIARGYRETELLVVCTDLYPERQLHFPVRACTAYVEKNKPATMKRMEEIAIVLDRSDLKPEAGFVRPDTRDGSAKNGELISSGNNK